MSGPGVGRGRSQVATPQGATIPVRALAIVRGLPEHSLIDRLVRGRAWIPVLGVLLAGIVAMQVEILKLGTSMGRSLERTAALQSQNESLQASVAALADDQRIERLATGMGMFMPSPSSLTFLHAPGLNTLTRALAGIHAPDPGPFAAQLAAQLAAAALIAPATNPAAPVSAAPGTTTTTASASSGATSPATTSSPPGGPASMPSGAGAGAAQSSGSGAGTGSPGGGVISGPTTGGPTTTGPTTTGPGAGVTTGAAALPSSPGSSSGSPPGG